MSRITTLVLMALLFGTPWNARSQTVSIEIDPAAYAMKGFSFHAGFSSAHVRYDVGVFGLTVPSSIHGNNGFENPIWGAGAKADYYFSGTNRGFYAGAGVDVTSFRVRLQSSGRQNDIAQLGIGINAGYQIPLARGLYIKPWLGVSYVLNAADLTIDARTFKQPSIRVFPTIHLGWEF